MAASGIQTAALSLGMMVSGAANSLLNKAQDRVCVGQCDTDEPEMFEQPVLQTLNMFAGECFCLIVIQILALYRYFSRHNAKYEILPQNVSSSQSQHRQRSALEETHFHPEQATEPPQGVIAAPPAALPVTLDPGAEALPQDQYQIKHLEGRQRLVFALPALCDITATTLMGAGLIFTPVSVYQMTRSALVLWVGLFSVIYLGRRLSRVELVSLFTVCLGVFVVGLSSASNAPGALPTADAGKVVLGVSLILFAQIFTAAQFVIEEKIMGRCAVEPLRAVGLEGIFGLIMTLVIMAVTFVLIGRTSAGKGGYFDAPAGFAQVYHSDALIWTSLACCGSIAFFNFFGLAVTKTVSATARSTIDTCRTALIWLCSLYLGWETFKPLQIVGFALTVYGTMCFNGVVSFPIRLGDEGDLKDDGAHQEHTPQANKPGDRGAEPTEQTALLSPRE